MKLSLRLTASSLGLRMMCAGCILFMLFYNPTRAAADPADYTYTESGGEAMITDYTGAGGAIVLPAVLDGYPVTGIAADAFRGNNSLTSVTIPDSVPHIGTFAFGWCLHLENVVLGSGVTTFPVNAFQSCVKLTDFTVSPDNTHHSSVAGVLFNRAHNRQSRIRSLYRPYQCIHRSQRHAYPGAGLRRLHGTHKRGHS